MSRSNVCLFLAAAVAALCSAAAEAKAEAVQIYAAGSLRGVIAALQPKAAAMNIDIVPVFGGSGELRDRIERGAKLDLFLSADMTSPRQLATERKTVAPPVAFARNRLCLVARQSLGLTPTNLVSRLLIQGIRIKTSKPIADPSGDYAFAMFDLMDVSRPGAGQVLHANANAQMNVTAAPSHPGQSATAALFEAQRIDVAVTYCSASADLAKQAAGLISIMVPTAFDPKPVFGLALLSANPSANRFAKLLLSSIGQSAIAAAGLLPISPARPISGISPRLASKDS
jgi:molybdate transport system substrate-binding protein